MNLIDLLTRLHQAAPEMCQISTPPKFKSRYQIGEYEFWEHSAYGFMASRHQGRGHSVDDRPALDWLTGALTAECERRKWIYDISRSENRQGEFYYEVTIHNKWNSLPKEANTLTEALLTALVAAAEAERAK